MTPLDPKIVEAVSTYPPIIMALAVVLGAVYMMLKLHGRERLDMEQSRREERKERDAQWQSFMAQQRDMDRTTGKQSSDVMAAALGELSAAFRELSSMVRGEISTLANDVRESLEVHAANITDVKQSVGSMRQDLGHELESLARQIKKENR